MEGMLPGRPHRVLLSYNTIKNLLDLLPLIPACPPSSLAFLMMYSAYKLNKQDDDIHPSYTPYPILNQSIIPCLILSVAFLRRQVRWSGIPISLRIFHSLL